MTPRTLIDRLLSPAGFGLVILLFLLPFVSVSCSPSDNPDETVTATFAGIDLVTGGTPTYVTSDATQEEVADDAAVAELDAMFGQFYPAQPLAILAFVIVLAGMIAGLVLPDARRAMITAGMALATAVLLAVQVIVIAPQKAADVRIEGVIDASLAHATPAYGFWLTIAVLIALALWQLFGAPRSAQPARMPDDTHNGSPPAP
jgi:hypothetical protein